MDTLLAQFNALLERGPSCGHFDEPVTDCGPCDTFTNAVCDILEQRIRVLNAAQNLN